MLGLGFLGYCVAEPLMNYFGGNSPGESEITSWAPDETTTEPEETTEPSSEATTAPPEEKAETGVYLPDNALSSSASYASALNTAKNNGASEIYILMKDTDGYLLYASETEAQGTDLIKGTMSLAEIVGRAKSEGIAPVAVINTLLDRTTPGVIEGISYRWADDSYAWLDAAAEKGGKRWVDPFKSETTEYFCSLVDELTKSGIKKIVLRNTIFPDFLEFDKTILAPHFFDKKSRADALSSLIKAMCETAEKNGADIVVEINAKDGFALEKSAEALSAVNFPITVAPIYNAADYNDGKLVVNGTENTLPTNQAERITYIVSRLRSVLMGKTVVPVINKEGIAPVAISTAIESLTEQGLSPVTK